jgi:hypothetical protein
VDALNALPITGGTVMVADGIWQIDSQFKVNNINNFSLVGQSLNARLKFVGGSGLIWFGSNNLRIRNAKFSTLTIDAGNLSSNMSAIIITSCDDCFLIDSAIIGHPISGVVPMTIEGGNNVQILRNHVSPSSGYGTSLQVQSGPGPIGTTGSGFVIADNTFDSAGITVIGLDNVTIRNNYLHNRMLGQPSGIAVCGPFGGTAHNVIIDGNTVDATVVPGRENAASISGLPNDPGGTSNLDGFYFTNNIVKGTVATIAVETFDQNCLLNCNPLGNKSNVTITGNQLSSLWGGANIDISGGTYGTVDTVLVEGNTLKNSAGAENKIIQDNHTYNATIRNNSL